MSIALPQTASAEMFNAVVRLAGEDAPALRQAKFRLEGLFRRSRSDVVAALGLLYVHVKLGERNDADVLADELWGRRTALALMDKVAFVPALSAIGQVDRALHLADDRLFESTPVAKEVRRVAAAHAFLTRWDQGMLRVDTPIHPDWLAQIEARGLLPHMQERQSVVNALVLPIQCGERLLFCPDGEDNLNLMRMVYVPLDYRARRELAGQISVALQSFYERLGIDPASASALSSEVILPVAALPAKSDDPARQTA